MEPSARAAKDKKRGRDEGLADSEAREDDGTTDGDGDGDGDDGSASDSDPEFAQFEQFLEAGGAGSDEDGDGDEDGEGLFDGSDAEAGDGEETLQERLSALHAALKTVRDEEEEEEDAEDGDGEEALEDGGEAGADGEVSDKRKRLLEKERERVAGMVRASEVPKASALAAAPWGVGAVRM